MRPDPIPDPPRHSPARTVMLGTTVLFYGAAGIIHLLSPDAFSPIVPDWVPQPRAVVLATGACEVAGATGLLIPRFRRLAGVMLALYAVCVFPANIKHAVENIDVPQLPHSWWYHGPRLVMQPVIVWWSLFCSGAIDWPFRRALSIRREQQDRGGQPVEQR